MAPVLTETDERLVLRTPTTMKSWSIFVGFVAVGAGAALFATDCCIWRLMYLIIGSAAGLWFLDDCEEVVFDKSLKTLQISVQKLFCTACCNRSESVNLADVTSVAVDECENKFAVKISLVNNTSFNVCDSQSAELDKIECQYLVDQICKFLHLEAAAIKPPLPRQTAEAPAPAAPVTSTTTLTSDLVSPHPETPQPEIPLITAEPSDESASVTSSEESFERVTAADLVEYDAVIADSVSADGTPPLPETLEAALTSDNSPNEAGTLPLPDLDSDSDPDKNASLLDPDDGGKGDEIDPK